MDVIEWIKRKLVHDATCAAWKIEQLGKHTSEWDGCDCERLELTAFLDRLREPTLDMECAGCDEWNLNEFDPNDEVRRIFKAMLTAAMEETK